MRLYTVFRMECPCGAVREVPDTTRQGVCRKCGRPWVIEWGEETPVIL